MDELRKKLNSLEKGFLSYRIKSKKDIILIPSLYPKSLLGLKGFPVNSVIEIYGESSSGKSYLVKNVINDLEKTEYIPIVFDCYNRLSSDKGIIIYTNTTSYIISSILSSISNKEKYAFIIDSLAGLDDPEYFISKIQGIISSMKKGSFILIYTNEMRYKIKKRKLQSYGGRDIKFYSNIRIKLHKIKHLWTLQSIKNTYGKCDKVEIKI